MVWYASRTVLAAEHVAEDPERFDVNQVAVPRVVRLELDHLVELHDSSDERLIRAADASIHTLGAVAGYGETIVLAYERMRGPSESGGEMLTKPGRRNSMNSGRGYGPNLVAGLM